MPHYLTSCGVRYVWTESNVARLEIASMVMHDAKCATYPLGEHGEGTLLQDESDIVFFLTHVSKSCRHSF